MKNAAVILLLIAYLFSATDIKELLKFDAIIDHLKEHRKADKSLTVIKFLAMHYVSDDQNDKDNDRDGRLPFKSSEKHSSILNLASYINKFSEISFNTPSALSNKFYPKNDFFLPISVYRIVWHPPQMF